MTKTEATVRAMTKPERVAYLQQYGSYRLSSHGPPVRTRDYAARQLTNAGRTAPPLMSQGPPAQAGCHSL
jgi:hypothetical protein